MRRPFVRGGRPLFTVVVRRPGAASGCGTDGRSSRRFTARPVEGQLERRLPLHPPTTGVYPQGATTSDSWTVHAPILSDIDQTTLCQRVNFAHRDDRVRRRRQEVHQHLDRLAVHPHLVPPEQGRVRRPGDRAARGGVGRRAGTTVADGDQTGGRRRADRSHPVRGGRRRQGAGGDGAGDDEDEAGPGRHLRAGQVTPPAG